MKFASTVLPVASFVSAFVIPDLQHAFSLENYINTNTEDITAYEKKPLVDTEALQKLITLEQLNASAIHLYEIAQQSLGKYDHPTRVIGSPGHWKTIDWITSTLANLSDYYTFTTQEFGALDGRVFNYSLELNNAPIKAKAFQLTPPAHVYEAELFVSENNGCSLEDFADLPPKGNFIALVKRGICPFGDKSANAGKAGAKGVLVYDENSEDIITGTLGTPDPASVGTLGIQRSTAKELLKLIEENSTVSLDFSIDSYIGYIKTKNVIAETVYGDHDNVVSLGAHSDSVATGPGINDDGSGTISLLTVAKQLTNFKLNNAVRFAWWAAEEEGLLGSNYYAEHLTPEENSKIRLFLDYDMMASPNYEYQVYNGSNEVNPKGSEEIKNLYIDWYESKGLNWTLIPFDGRSDYVGFIEHGIPGGGIAAGAEGLNSQNGEVLDKCYHELCDDLTNIAWDAFLINTQLIAHSVATYANSLEGFPLREAQDLTVSSSSSYKFRGSHLII